MILGYAALHPGALLLSLTPSTSGLVLVGAENEEKTNQGPVGNSCSSGRFPAFMGGEGLCSSSSFQALKTLWGPLVLAWEGLGWVLSWSGRRVKSAGGGSMCMGGVGRGWSQANQGLSLRGPRRVGGQALLLPAAPWHPDLGPSRPPSSWGIWGPVGTARPTAAICSGLGMVEQEARIPTEGLSIGSVPWGTVLRHP